MDIYILGQDNTFFGKSNGLKVDINSSRILDLNGWFVGEYENRERCIEVIKDFAGFVVGATKKQCKSCYYEMPKE